MSETYRHLSCQNCRSDKPFKKVDQFTSGDNMSRVIFRPRMVQGIESYVWDEIFQFPKNANRTESLVWRAIAKCSACVHLIGNKIQGDGIRKQYAGFFTANVGDIESAKTTVGHGFSLAHVPEEGGDWHVHIKVESSEGRQITAQDKWDIRAEMRRVFTKQQFEAAPANTLSTGEIPDALAQGP